MLNKDVLDDWINGVCKYFYSGTYIILIIFSFQSLPLFLEGQKQHISWYVKDRWKILNEEMKEYTNKQTDEKSSAGSLSKFSIISWKSYP